MLWTLKIDKLSVTIYPSSYISFQNWKSFQICLHNKKKNKVKWEVWSLNWFYICGKFLETNFFLSLTNKINSTGILIFLISLLDFFFSYTNWIFFSWKVYSLQQLLADIWIYFSNIWIMTTINVFFNRSIWDDKGIIHSSSLIVHLSLQIYSKNYRERASVTELFVIGNH